MSSSVSQMILLAEIGAPHGVQGHFRLRYYTETPEQLFSYDTFWNDSGRAFALEFVQRRDAHVCIARMPEVSDRTTAERFKGTRVYVKRTQLQPLPEDEFYFADLTGLTVCDLEGETVGVVELVENYGAGDFLQIKSVLGETLTVAFRREHVLDVSLEKKMLRVDRNALFSMRKDEQIG